jgi:hypothetical protein
MAGTTGAEDFSTLHESVLRFMGAFTAAQLAIDTMIGIYLGRQMPELGPELTEQFLRRVRDDQRAKLFAAFAAEVGYQGDLANFRYIYNRAKELRDMIGHAINVIGPVNRAGGDPIVGVARASNSSVDHVPSPLYPSTFVRFTADCEWLSQHAYRAGYEAMPDAFVDMQGNPAEPPIPASAPVGGEPVP